MKSVACLSVATVLAGCAGEYEPSPGLVDSDPEKADEHITTVIEYYTEISEYIAQIDEEIIDIDDLPLFSREYIDRRVEIASDELDTAETVASTAQLDLISDLRTFGQIFSAFARYFENMFLYLDGYNTILAYVDSDRLNDALRRFDDLEVYYSEMASAVDAVETSFGKFDSTRLTETEQLNYLEFKDSISIYVDSLDIFRLLIDGFRPLIKGVEHFQLAFDALDNDDLDTARNQLAVAESEFNNAYWTFNTAEDSGGSIPGIEGAIIELGCVSEAMRDASRYYNLAIDTIQTGNEAQTEYYVNQADDSLNRCNL